MLSCILRGTAHSRRHRVDPGHAGDAGKWVGSGSVATLNLLGGLLGQLHLDTLNAHPGDTAKQSGEQHHNDEDPGQGATVMGAFKHSISVAALDGLDEAIAGDDLVLTLIGTAGNGFDYGH